MTVVEQVEAEIPASVTVLDQQRLRAIPGVNLDDRLRQVPGFSLFRRSSSAVANPTTQGVSLRGIGSTGASRTLVLWDGVPLNDPFGGWLYWTRVAPEEVDRVEVVRSAVTSVFGDRALGGAVTVFSRPPEQRRAWGLYESGNRRTHQVGAGLSHLARRWAASGQARAFTTDGYYIVQENQRGPIDTQADLRFVAGDVRLDYLGGADRLFLKLDALTEERENGTRLQHNSTSLGALSANYAREFGPSSNVSLLAYHSRGEYRASFSAIAADRATERLTSIQSVPWEATGGAGYWRQGGPRGSVLAGADFQRVEGTSTDRLFPTGARVGGGSLFQRGAFAQANVITGRLQWFGGVRQQFGNNDQRFFAPSAGVVTNVGRLRLRGSSYRAFRAPTLNELYREFRVGNAVTQANAALRPETLAGVEVGADVVAEASRLSVTAFRNSLSDLVTNVTLSVTPNQIVRQRQNAAGAVARGIEVELRHRRGPWLMELSYLLADSRFSSGERVPQIARHQGTSQLTYQRNGTLLSLGFRTLAAQFEDDRNLFLLPGFATLQLAAQQRVSGSLSLYAAVENLTNREFLVGFTPLGNTGAPRLWRLGLRWR